MAVKHVSSYAIFCDDIRQEIGNKLSFMGIYLGEMNIAMPSRLNNLWVAMTVDYPIKTPPKTVVMQIWRDEELYREHPLDPDEIAKMFKQIHDSADHSVPLRLFQIQGQVNLGPLDFVKPQVIQARFVSDGKEIIAGSLRVTLPPHLKQTVVA